MDALTLDLVGKRNKHHFHAFCMELSEIAENPHS